MFSNLMHDLESALKNFRVGDLTAGLGAGPKPEFYEHASLSHWLPYRAYLEDSQVFINRDALGYCLEVRPQSGSDEDMARVLTALYAS